MVKLLALGALGNLADCMPCQVFYCSPCQQSGSATLLAMHAQFKLHHNSEDFNVPISRHKGRTQYSVLQPDSEHDFLYKASRGSLSAVCQVALAPSALAADDSGTAASVAVAGGNKVKLKDGEALFKAVRIEAEAPGIYTLHAKSASRKVRCQHDIPYHHDGIWKSTHT